MLANSTETQSLKRSLSASIPPEYEIKILRSLEAIAPAEWDALFPGIPENRNFYKTVESTLSCQFQFYYVAVLTEGRPVCIAPCFLMDYPLDTPMGPPLKKVVGLIRRFMPGFFCLRILFCGLPTGEGKVGVSPADCDKTTLALLVGGLEAAARDARSRVTVFKDIPERYTSFLDPLREAGFHKIGSYPLVELDLHFGSFEEYFETLSRATKKDLKRKFRKIDGLQGLKFEVRDDAGALLEDIDRLYLNTFEKSDVRFEKVTKDFFREIPRNMPGECKYFLWFLKGRLVAFDLCVVSDGFLIDEYVGMDYSVALDLHLYFSTFRDIIRWCIENGVKKYRSGALNYDPKKRLGFKFLPQYLYVRHRGRLGNFFIGLLARSLKPENFDPTLKLLKQRGET